MELLLYSRWQNKTKNSGTLVVSVLYVREIEELSKEMKRIVLQIR